MQNVKLLGLKRQSCMNETVDKGGLMLLINIAWNKSFARVDKNRRDIADRGWGPYNRNILTFSHIRATMTETDRIYDLNIQIVLSSSESVSTITNDSSFCNNFLSSDIRFSDSSETNLNIGIAATITDSIIQHEDRLLARERIKKNRMMVTHLKVQLLKREKYLLDFLLNTVRLYSVKHYLL